MAEISETKADDINANELDAELGSGYGIFAGKDIQLAILKFTPERAKWVASEKWHPEQRSKFLDDGSYQLEVPYSDERELIMDIMKYGKYVKVVSPISLIESVIEALKKTIKNYNDY